MNAKAVDLAAAIVARLNGTELSVPFTAAGRAVPIIDEESPELNTLQVYVLVNTKKAVRLTREEFQRTYKPVVVVQKRLAVGNDTAQLAEANELQGVVEEIEVRLEDADYTDIGLSFVGFDEENDRDAYGVETMKGAGIFAVAITLEYDDGAE